MDTSFRTTQGYGLSQYRFSQATSPPKTQRWTSPSKGTSIENADNSSVAATGYGYAEALRPLTIRQVTMAHRPHPDACFEVDGKKVYHVSLVAQVMAMDITGVSGNKFQLDDSTGRTLTAMQWAKHLPEGFQDIPDRGLDFMEYDYVRVVGTIDMFRDRKMFLVKKIYKIVDPHEIFHHLLDVMVTNLRIEKGPPPPKDLQQAVGAASVVVPAFSQIEASQIPNSPPPSYQSSNHDSPAHTPQTPQPQRRRTSSVGSSASQVTPRRASQSTWAGKQSASPEPSPPPSPSSEDEGDGTDYFSVGTPSPESSRPPTPPPPPVPQAQARQPRASKGRDPLSNLTSLERDIYLEIQTKTTGAMIYPFASISASYPRKSEKSRGKAVRGPEWIHWDEIIKSVIEIRGYSPHDFSPALDMLNSLGLIDIDQEPSHNGEGWLKITG
jgi:hypothetical protein